MAEYRPIHFYDEQIEVLFNTPPVFEKIPDCPNGFVWEEKTYCIVEILSEWNDFTRRGKYARNMRPAHAAVASNRGSLNVGRFYFRVKAALSGSTIVSPLGAAGQSDNHLFDLYYDRAMKSVDERKGQWFLYRELAEI
jgi:hypothetical protein